MPAPPATDKQQLFETHAFFGQLGPADRDALIAHARFEHYSAGDEIFAKGSPGRSMVAVIAGAVRISSPSASGKEVVLAIVHAGEIFGEIALLDGGERTADATAMTDCDLLVIDHRDFIPFLERRSDACLLLLKLLCQRLRQTNRYVEEALFEQIASRMAKALMRLASEEGHKNGGPVSLRLSQQELGQMIGVSRESVNKQLHIWQRAGLVELGKRLIVLRDPADLEDMI